MRALRPLPSSAFLESSLGNDALRKERWRVANLRELSLIQFEANRLGKPSLLPIEGVQAIDAKFQSGSHVQKVGGAGSELRRGLPRFPRTWVGA